MEVFLTSPEDNWKQKNKVGKIANQVRMDVAFEANLAFEASKEAQHRKVVILKGVCNIFEKTKIIR